MSQPENKKDAAGAASEGSGNANLIAAATDREDNSIRVQMPAGHDAKSISPPNDIAIAISTPKATDTNVGPSIGQLIWNSVFYCGRRRHMQATTNEAETAVGNLI